MVSRGRKSWFSPIETPNREAPKSNWTPKSYPQVPQSPFISPITTVDAAFVDSVILHDWWLEKPNAGKGLAVGGFASTGMLGIRVFKSAAISKRHSPTILETEDDITVTVIGLLNRSRTCQNGFPSQACNKFLIGFPFDWKEYTACCLDEESTDGDTQARYFASENLLPFSLDNLPVAMARDILFSSFEDFDYSLFTRNISHDVLRTSRSNGSVNANALTSLNMEGSIPEANRKSPPNDTPVEHAASQKNNKVSDCLEPMNMRRKKYDKHGRRPNRNAPSLKVGVLTRSMRKKLEEAYI